MTCDEFEANVHEYMRGTLMPDQVTAAEEHLAECRKCSDRLGQLSELRCRDFVDFLNDYLDGELEGDQRLVFDRHLSVCPDCDNYLHSYRQTMDLSVASLKDQAPVPDKIPESLVKAILAARK